MHTVSTYVIGVLIVMAVIIGIAHWAGSPKEKDIIYHCGSFLFGMLAMYIAVRVYGL
jgi:hypothetical protein